MRERSFVPLSALELRDAVRRALPYDPLRLDRILHHDESSGLIEVQGSARWKTLAAYLRPGDAQAATARTTMSTVADSIARNAAGPDGTPAVAHVESLTLVTPDGDLRRASRYANRDLFALTVGGQGLFGVLYSVTLRVDSMARALEHAAPSEKLIADADATSQQALQLLLPPARVAHCVAEIHSRCAERHTALLALEVRRTREENETLLRWASRDFAEIRLELGAAATLGQTVRSAQLTREFIDIAIAHGGSFPIACTPQATRAQIEACYPQLKSFLAEKRLRDPAERLVNRWYREHRGLFERGGAVVRWGP